MQGQGLCFGHFVPVQVCLLPIVYCCFVRLLCRLLDLFVLVGFVVFVGFVVLAVFVVSVEVVVVAVSPLSGAIVVTAA